MLTQIRPAIVMILFLSTITGIIYPLAITGIAQVVAAEPANGSLITRNGVVIGSSLIGQQFSGDGYFHGRPSATSTADPNDATKTIDAPYNAANSAASNFGPTSAKLVDRVKAAVETLGGSANRLIPADAVTTSGSGLDPDISPAFAQLQVSRIAAARKLDAAVVQSLVDGQTSRPVLGIFGEPRVNVLQLNMRLDLLATK